MDSNRFTEKAVEVLLSARQLAVQYGQQHIDAEHVLLALLEQQDGLATKVAANAGAPLDRLKERVRGQLEKLPRVSDVSPDRVALTPRCERVLARAEEEAKQMHDEFTSADALLLAMSGDVGGTQTIPAILREFGLTREKLLEGVKAVRGTLQAQEMYGRDMTRRSALADGGPFIGREGTMQWVIHALLDRTQRKPLLLVGKPGVGKTEFMEAVVERLARADLAERIWLRRVIKPDIAALTAGARGWPEVRQRLRSLLSVPDWHAGLVLIVDDLHIFFQSLGIDGPNETAGVLGSALSHGKVQLLATVPEQWFGQVSSAGLEFDARELIPPSVEETSAILRSWKRHMEQDCRASIKDAALAKAADLAARYNAERAMPDRAIRLVQEAATRSAMSAHMEPPELRQAQTRLYNLQLQRDSLRREADQSIREQLVEVEKELTEAETRWRSLKEQWESERASFRRVCDLEARIATARQEQEAAMQNGDFRKTAEIQYGTLPALEHDVEQERGRFGGLPRGSRLVKPDVGAEDIEMLVAEKLASGDFEEPTRIAPPAEKGHPMVTILFLAANPTDATRLALDVEYREIQARLRAIPERRFRLAHAPAIQAKELTNEILQSRPTIVHFSGHGSPQGELVLVDANSKAAPVNQEALAEVLRIFSDRVRCVVLNACFSKPQAELIAQHVEAVVGISSAVNDSAAIAFAETFYNALGHGEHLQNAFDLARTAIPLVGIPQDVLPELIHRADVDPKRIVL